MPLSRERMRVYQAERRRRLRVEKAERERLRVEKGVDELVEKVMEKRNAV